MKQDKDKKQEKLDKRAAKLRENLQKRKAASKNNKIKQDKEKP